MLIGVLRHNDLPGNDLRTWLKHRPQHMSSCWPKLRIPTDVARETSPKTYEVRSCILHLSMYMA